MNARPTILVTNDDGFDSPGLVALADALAEIGDVTVVAPDRDRSGVGHSVSIESPVRVTTVPDRSVATYRCSGTPADCVIVGAADLCGGTPDLLVSGINRGANLGDDVNYSGTVAAAFEGLVVGIPSVAISLAARRSERGRTQHWKTATDVVRRVVVNVLTHGLPRLTLLNVNVPNVPGKELRGIRWVRQARKSYRDRAERREDGNGESYYWLSGTFDSSTIVEGTDLAAVRDGYASVTPITIDRTDHEELGRRIREERQTTLS